MAYIMALGEMVLIDFFFKRSVLVLEIFRKG